MNEKDKSKGNVENKQLCFVGGCTRPEVWNMDAWEVGRIWAGAAVLD